MRGSVTVNTSHVVHETIDGEAILIHLGTGTYYSLDGIGAEVWELLVAGADREGLLAAAVERYDGERDTIERGLSRLVDELLREELLLEVESRPAAVRCDLPAGRVPFVDPVLNIYTDMQEFMLVDPLHDVDETAGWPHAKTR
jgi:hypothetical protein